MQVTDSCFTPKALDALSKRTRELLQYLPVHSVLRCMLIMSKFSEYILVDIVITALTGELPW